MYEAAPDHESAAQVSHHLDGAQSATLRRNGFGKCDSGERPILGRRFSVAIDTGFQSPTRQANAMTIRIGNFLQFTRSNKQEIAHKSEIKISIKKFFNNNNV
jgi:hypothetical protein